MLSLARTDGAQKDILELCTRTPRKSGHTRYRWQHREKESPEAPDGARGLATCLAAMWRRRESNPRPKAFRPSTLRA